jgi:hypothetical protein
MSGFRFAQRCSGGFLSALVALSIGSWIPDVSTQPTGLIPTTLSVNVANRSLSDAESHPRRTETHNINIRRPVKAESPGV